MSISPLSEQALINDFRPPLTDTSYLDQKVIMAVKECARCLQAYCGLDQQLQPDPKNLPQNTPDNKAVQPLHSGESPFLLQSWAERACQEIQDSINAFKNFLESFQRSYEEKDSNHLSLMQTHLKTQEELHRKIGEALTFYNRQMSAKTRFSVLGRVRRAFSSYSSVRSKYEPIPIDLPEYRVKTTSRQQWKLGINATRELNDAMEELNSEELAKEPGNVVISDKEEETDQ